jgi:hypothetical protein
MTEPAADANLSPLELLARQNAALEDLRRTVELQQIQLEALRRRVQALEGVPWPDQEPPEAELPRHLTARSRTSPRKRGSGASGTRRRSSDPATPPRTRLTWRPAHLQTRICMPAFAVVPRPALPPSTRRTSPHATPGSSRSTPPPGGSSRPVSPEAGCQATSTTGAWPPRCWRHRRGRSAMPAPPGPRSPITCAVRAGTPTPCSVPDSSKPAGTDDYVTYSETGS